MEEHKSKYKSSLHPGMPYQRKRLLSLDIVQGRTRGESMHMKFILNKIPFHHDRR